MATLRSPRGDTIILRARHLVGRSRSMHTRLDWTSASAEHAVLAWSAGTWTVRDLGSRNGTTLDGRRLDAGEQATLREGAVLTFGEDQETFTLLSDGPPSPAARDEAGAVVEGDGDLLALPSPDDPQLVITFEVPQGWVVVQQGGVAAALHGQLLEITGRRWTLNLPEMLEPTGDMRANSSSVDAVGLRFRVSGDEEYVELDVLARGQVHTLKPKSHHHVLLTLARERLQDQATGVSAPEQGWVYTSELAKMLGANSNQLYVSIHRARKELEDLGVFDAANIVERRALTRQVRLGISDVVVAGL
jgi:hypothetical protein